MSFLPNYISAYQSGLKKNKKPFLLIDDAFQELTNAYVWRERVKKREGLKLVGRLRRVFTAQAAGSVTIGVGATTFNLFTQLSIAGEPNASIEPGDISTISLALGAPVSQTFTDSTGTGVMTGFSGNITGVSINYATGDVTVISNPGYAAATLTATLNYYPSLPAMGIEKRELAAVNLEQTTFFDTNYVYTYDGNNFSSPSTSAWAGGNSDFFWMENYRGITADSRLFFVTNNAGAAASANNRIRYTTDGATYTDFTPGVAGTSGNPETADVTFIFQCKIIIAYYGRLLFFNTWEGTTAGASTNFFNRCRFSQIGSPIQATSVGPPFVGGAWRSDIFGKGGFIDAPTNEAIVSARFYKDTLIVFFEKTSWALNYIGEYGLPFVWERISSDLGSESTHSTVLFDDGVLAVGDKAIIASNSNNVERIDLDVPDTVFGFANQNNGKERVHGVRDFRKEIVFWTYPDGNTNAIFPNRVLIYNYRNASWATFRDNVTCFGEMKNASGDSWDLPIPWDSNTSWDTLYNAELPKIVSGNQQGYIHYYQSVFDPDTTSDTAVPAIENESLQITALTRSTTANLQITVPDHNLETGELVYVSGMVFANTANGTTVATNLNDRIYQVINVSTGGSLDTDLLDLKLWNATSQSYEPTDGTTFSFTPATGTGTYMGGGELTLLPNINILTKDFNPFANKGLQFKSSFVDFQTDSTSNSAVSVNVLLNNAPSVVGNIETWNSDFPTAINDVGEVTNATQANPCVISSENHGLVDGRIITFGEVNGMTNLNGNLYTVTFVDEDSFSLNSTDSSGFGAYTFGGRWWAVDQWKFYIPGQKYAWHRFYANLYGQYLAFQITYNDNLMNQITTHQSNFELNAMNIWAKPAGRLF